MAAHAEYQPPGVSMLREREPVRGTLILIVIAGALGAVFLAWRTVFSAVDGIRDSDVRDADTARTYLLQEIQAYLPDGGTETTGTFAFRSVPGHMVGQFLSEQGIVDESWASDPPDTALVISWTSSEARFQAPRPRAGFEATIRGDTFMVILSPDDGRKLTAVVDHSVIRQLVEAASDTVSEQVTVSR